MEAIVTLYIFIKVDKRMEMHCLQLKFNILSTNMFNICDAACQNEAFVFKLRFLICTNRA